ncbi:unnamed protein product [Ambrosiozyma monospora]|uniref:Unnamed protein product n=1 Tax=Ambrosiozyma monospora TaxID=43982 RepID=A0ACB5TW23_AMBMO|nr:unnamed protein product [Ambrosiozyma monospora]
MERYPTEISSILAPLVIVQGLGQDGLPEGTVHNPDSATSSSTDKTLTTDKSWKLPSSNRKESSIFCDLDDPTLKDNYEIIDRKIPMVQAASGLELVSLLNSYNVGDNYWLLDNNKEYMKQLNYNIKFIGNRFVLPKTNKRTPPVASPASIPTSPVLGSSALSSPSIGPSPSIFTSASTKTYSSSILSPFNADSEFFNSLLPIEWIQRYREQRPFVFISVHELATKDDNIDLTVADTELANEISRIKSQCTSNNVKHLSIILCSKSIALNPELDERVAQLRKVTSLPARSGLLFLPAGTQREVENFAASVAHLIKPWAVEYFNALEKKFKKRTLQNLEYPEKSWLARQALKSAIAAEMKGISDYSTKAMEYCYEKLIDATRQLDMLISSWVIVTRLIRNLTFISKT